jgi:predicted transglutaminase-like cysteine proteinase
MIPAAFNRSEYFSMRRFGFCILALLLWTFAYAQSEEPFGLSTFPAAESGSFARAWVAWRAAEIDISAERALLRYCREYSKLCDDPAARRFLEIINEGAKLLGRARIGIINRDINLAIRPMSDLKQYGVEYVWSSPLATLTSGAGSCMDYAIAKYVALGEAGLADDDLRIVGVRDTKVRDAHAVVAARESGNWLILDNRSMLLLEPSQLEHYIPIFTIDHRGIRQYRHNVATVASCSLT